MGWRRGAFCFLVCVATLAACGLRDEVAGLRHDVRQGADRLSTRAARLEGALVESEIPELNAATRALREELSNVRGALAEAQEGLDAIGQQQHAERRADEALLEALEAQARRQTEAVEAITRRLAELAEGAAVAEGATAPSRAPDTPPAALPSTELTRLVAELTRVNEQALGRIEDAIRERSARDSEDDEVSSERLAGVATSLQSIESRLSDTSTQDRLIALLENASLHAARTERTPVFPWAVLLVPSLLIVALGVSIIVLQLRSRQAPQAPAAEPEEELAQAERWLAAIASTVLRGEADADTRHVDTPAASE